jgi:hypothetical protein
MSDWDTQPITQPSDPALVAQAKEFADLSKRKEEIDARLEVLSDQILTAFTEEAGEQTIAVTNNLQVNVVRSERWTWDTELLDDIFAQSNSLPPHVKKRITVDKRKFQALDEDQRRELLPALTRKPGPAKITVKEADNV